MTKNEIHTKTDERVAITIGSGNDWNISGLATSATRVGRQSDIIDNTTNQYAIIEVSLKIRLGTSPVANTMLYLHLIRSNGTERSDGAGAGDAALTQLNAPLLGTMRAGFSPSTGDDIYGTFPIFNPGREWALMLWHDTGVNLDATDGDHTVGWVGMLPEVQ